MLARQHGSVWTILAPAKLNLYLEVLGRRRDGFHELETLMAPVRLYDLLRWSPADGFSFRLHPASDPSASRLTPTDDANLVVRAARRLADETGVRPHGRFELCKRIPPGSGMGGGSSDAAAALALANAAWQTGLSRVHLASLAAELGCDVPFFFAGGAAVCQGRGEVVAPIEGLPRLHFSIIKPPAGVSTSEAFSRLDAGSTNEALVRSSQDRLERLLGALRAGHLARAAQTMSNGLQRAAACLNSAVANLDAQLEGIDAYGHFMTGSGSAFAVLCRSGAHARRVSRQLFCRTLGQIWTTSTCH